jgi:hypothetical protein
MPNDFIYTEQIEEVMPLVFNIALSKDRGYDICEFRKKVSINDSTRPVLKKLFTAALAGKPVKIDVQIVFRDEVMSAIRLKEMGLLDINISVKKEEVLKALKE